jgi:hypothetical protein
MDVLWEHLPPNLDLLNKELSGYPGVPVITLGQPVLQLLAGEDAQVHYYWGYDKKLKIKANDFKHCPAGDNKLKRDLFPFPHQPSIIKNYYSNNRTGYLEFMKDKCKEYKQ